MPEIVDISQTNLVLADIGATTKTIAQLNADYPSAKPGNQVHADTLFYVRTENTWLSFPHGAITQSTRQIDVANWHASNTEVETWTTDIKTVYFFGANASASEFKFQFNGRYDSSGPAATKDFLYFFYNQSDKAIRIEIDVPGNQYSPNRVNQITGENKFVLAPNESCIFKYDYAGDDLVLLSHSKEPFQIASFSGNNSSQIAYFTPATSGNYNISGSFLISKDNGWFMYFTLSGGGDTLVEWNDRTDDNPGNDAKGRQEFKHINLVKIPLIGGTTYSLQVTMVSGASTYNKLIGGAYSNLKIEKV